MQGFVGYKRPVRHEADTKAGKSRLPPNTVSAAPEPIEALFAKVSAMEGGSIFT